jgi:hypothetical protein
MLSSCQTPDLAALAASAVLPLVAHTADAQSEGRMEQVTEKQVRRAVCAATGWDLSSTTGAKMRLLFSKVLDELLVQHWGNQSQVGAAAHCVPYLILELSSEVWASLRL